MPAFSTLLVYSVAALALIVVPGPNHLYIVTRGIGQGRRAAVASAAGVSRRSIMGQENRKSVQTVRRYVREGTLFENTAAASVGS